MREILFRGKRTDNGEWVEGYLSKSRGNDKQLELCIDYEEKGVMCSSIIIPETVGQYTGLTDKNGKRIFEGDIVSQIWYDYHEPIRDSLGEVIFNELNSSFSVVDVKKDAVFSFNPFSGYDWEIEVIGNIHDNSDLLEGGVKNDRA